MLAVWSALVAAVRIPVSTPASWRYFYNAAGLVFGGRRSHGRAVGLSVYHLHPRYQFGPLSIAAAEMLRVVGRSHVVLVAQLTFVGVGLLTLWLVGDAAGRLRGGPGGDGSAVLSRGPFLVAGATFIFEWDHLAIDALHIDDAIAFACVAFALAAIARRSAWWWPALAIGAATAAKPWAIMLVPILLALPSGRRRVGVLTAVFVGLVVWAPFVVADSRTLLTARYTTINASSSVLRLFGVRDARTPRWDRVAQLLGAVALGLAAAARKRWAGIVLVAVAFRIMLDPSVNTYYTTGLVFGAVVWDLTRSRWRWPLTTVIVTVVLELSTVVALPPAWAAALRLAACVGAIAAVAIGQVRSDGPSGSTPGTFRGACSLQRREEQASRCLPMAAQARTSTAEPLLPSLSPSESPPTDAIAALGAAAAGWRRTGGT